MRGQRLDSFALTLTPNPSLNPGWSSDAQQLREFTDVRELQRQLKDRGVNMISEADESSTGPASFMIVDPDGNTILVDQHV
jgi:lactoylglutathione lyase